LARLLIHMRRSQHSCYRAGRRERDRPGNAGTRPFGRVHDFGRGLIEHPVIVSLQTDVNAFSQRHNLPGPYSTISVTVPAPTVRPPSRIAKRRPLSMATGVISSTTSGTLSPGITISVPAGSSATPVTSVVRK